MSGVPIYMVRASEAYERIIPDWDKDMLTKLGVEMRAYFDLMKRIAVAYNNSAANPELQKEMKQKFLAMYDHITDQGVTYGSCWGNIHHYGYSVRGFVSGIFPDERRYFVKLVSCKKLSVHCGGMPLRMRYILNRKVMELIWTH